MVSWEFSFVFGLLVVLLNVLRTIYKRHILLICKCLNTFSNFLFHQSLGLIIIVTIFGIFYMGSIYYSLTTVNHVGTLISTDVYNSALDLINPIKRLRI